jgi:hypothetical protein
MLGLTYSCRRGAAQELMTAACKSDDVGHNEMQTYNARDWIQAELYQFVINMRPSGSAVWEPGIEGKNHTMA